jgi:metal-responsive CopG/Arc/MetJ family transcriptional regulator
MADNGTLRELVETLARGYLEDRERWRANDENLRAMVSAIQQQNVQIQQALAEVHQQGEILLKHEGHIDAMQKTIHRMLEGRSSKDGHS